MSHLFSYFDYKNIFLVSLFLFFFYLSFRAFIKSQIEGMSDDEKRAQLDTIADEYTSNAYENIKTIISNESMGSSNSVSDVVRKHKADIQAIVENQSNLNNSDSVKKRVDDVMKQLTGQIEDTNRKVESVKGSGITFNNEEERQKIIGIVKTYIVPK
jgi:hypothetical protein